MFFSLPRVKLRPGAESARGR